MPKTSSSHTKVMALCVRDDQHETFRRAGGSRWFRAAIADALRKAHAIRRDAIRMSGGDFEKAEKILIAQPCPLVPDFTTNAQRIYWEGVLRIAREALEDAARTFEAGTDVRAMLSSLEISDRWDLPDDKSSELPKEHPNKWFYLDKHNPFL